MKIHQFVAKPVEAISKKDGFLLWSIFGGDKQNQEGKRWISSRCGLVTDRSRLTTDRSKVTCKHCLGQRKK